MSWRANVAGGLVGLAGVSTVWAPGDWGTGVSLSLAGAAAWIVSRREKDVVARLGGLVWTLSDFARGWLITGDIGSGKTSSGIVQLMRQVFLNVPTWGGLCIDEKGVFWETLTKMASHHGREEDVIVLEIRPEHADAAWQPRHRFNLVGDRSIPFSAYARMVVDAARSLGQDSDQNFFREQAELHIAAGLEALHVIGYDVTLENLCHLLTEEEELTAAIAQLRQAKSEDGSRLAEHFEGQLLRAPFEQRSGVTSTILNYLRHFIDTEVAEVFCRDSTVTLEQVDSGKIFCLLMPHRHHAARRYVGVFLKSLFYLHVLRRYNLPADERLKRNLLVTWVDEAQRFVTTSKTGYGEQAVVDLVREARCAVVFATQSTVSFSAPLGRDVAKIVTLNLRNRMAFKAADQEDAEEAATRLGKRKKRKVTWTSDRDGTRRNISMDEDYVVSPHDLRRLRSHQCLLIHCRGKHRRVILPPLLPNGRVAPWFRRWWFY